MTAEVLVGCAGWSIPREHAACFPGDGTHLERYARRLAAVEINSSFYRPHRPATYARWAASVPESFRFAVKAPRAITHERRLRDCDELLDRWLGEVAALGACLGPLLVQLPPSLAFDPVLAGAFFDALRERCDGDVVCEPRHATWFTRDAETLLQLRRIARVAADPAVVPTAALPGGWAGLVYYRLHGSPRMYYDRYGHAYLQELAGVVQAAAARGIRVWVIFDNTAEGFATLDALDLLELLGDGCTLADVESRNVDSSRSGGTGIENHGAA